MSRKLTILEAGLAAGQRPEGQSARWRETLELENRLALLPTTK